MDSGYYGFIILQIHNLLFLWIPDFFGFVDSLCYGSIISLIHVFLVYTLIISRIHSFIHLFVGAFMISWTYNFMDE